MAAGADGSTLDELLSFLRFDSVDHLTTFFSQVVSPVLFSDDHLCFANGMWVDQSVSLSHSFKQLVATHYKATLASLDFQTQGNQVLPQVNSWVAKETNGHITHLVPPKTVTDLTRFIFANALLFKSAWKYKFGLPLERVFRLLDGTSVKVLGISNMRKTQYVKAYDGFKILRLPFKQGSDKKRRFSMCIFLPDAVDGLPALIQKLSMPGFLKGKIPRRKTRVTPFMIPKFRISFAFEASNVLKELGVVSPFSPMDADFTKMAEANSTLDKIYVESIFHKGFIDVNEKGTEANADCLVMGRKSIGACLTRKDISFYANRPFLFLIREDFTGTILFIGQVLNPLDGAHVQRRREIGL